MPSELILRSLEKEERYAQNIEILVRYNKFRELWSPARQAQFPLYFFLFVLSVHMCTYVGVPWLTNGVQRASVFVSTMMAIEIELRFFRHVSKLRHHVSLPSTNYNPGKSLIAPLLPFLHLPKGEESKDRMRRSLFRAFIISTISMIFTMKPRQIAGVHPKFSTCFIFLSPCQYKLE